MQRESGSDSAEGFDIEKKICQVGAKGVQRGLMTNGITAYSLREVAPVAL